jgi:hypothetical protein
LKLMRIMPKARSYNKYYRPKYLQVNIHAASM